LIENSKKTNIGSVPGETLIQSSLFVRLMKRQKKISLHFIDFKAAQQFEMRSVGIYYWKFYKILSSSKSHIKPQFVKPKHWEERTIQDAFNGYEYLTSRKYWHYRKA